jgi:putative hydrolase of the HAD superfamily
MASQTSCPLFKHLIFNSYGSARWSITLTIPGSSSIQMDLKWVCPMRIFSFIFGLYEYTNCMSQPPNFRNILFDLGGVILDINVTATQQKFFEMGLPAVFLQYPENMLTDLYFRYETGKIDTVEYRNEVRRISGLDLMDEVIDEAWIAMLVGIPAERTELIGRLKERYGLYMLSNTCPLHSPVFEKMYQDAAGIPMHDIFDGIYYSYEIGFHKPDREAWEYVIEDAGIDPRETLYIDDSIHNIKASQELGFQAIHIHERTSMMALGFDL